MPSRIGRNTKHTLPHHATPLKEGASYRSYYTEDEETSRAPTLIGRVGWPVSCAQSAVLEREDELAGRMNTKVTTITAKTEKSRENQGQQICQSVPLRGEVLRRGCMT